MDDGERAARPHPGPLPEGEGATEGRRDGEMVGQRDGGTRGQKVAKEAKALFVPFRLLLFKPRQNGLWARRGLATEI